MNIVTVTRKPISRSLNRRSHILRSFRAITGTYFVTEKNWELLIEALFFIAISALSIWPIFEVVEALRQFIYWPAA